MKVASVLSLISSKCKKLPLSKAVVVPILVFGFYGADAISAGNDEGYIVLDQQLKKVMSDNPHISSPMSLFNFSEGKPTSADIYRLTADSGKLFIPQDDSSILLYEKYIESGFLPIIAVLETNKFFIEVQEEGDAG